MEIPVRRHSECRNNQLAIPRSINNGSTSMNQHNVYRGMEDMNGNLFDLEPFGIFPSWRNSGGFMERVQGQFRQLHNEMMRSLDQSAINTTWDDVWKLPTPNDCFFKGSDGNTCFRATFNLQSFDPQDIEVVQENNLLSVKARKSRECQNSASRQYFARSMTLPSGVEVDKLNSYLSKDGVLTVEAPAPSVQITENAQIPSRNRISIEDSSARQRRMSRRWEHVIERGDGSRWLYIAMPIDDIYAEGDVSVKCNSGALKVRGSKENGDDSFSRTFAIPKTIDPEQLEAVFRNGVLTIQGPLP